MFKINQGFDLKSPQFNFERDYFKDLATLKAASEDWFPDHFITNVAGVLYQLDKSGSVDATTGRWRPLSSTTGNGLTFDGNNVTLPDSDGYVDAVGSLSMEGNKLVCYGVSDVATRAALQNYVMKSDMSDYVNNMELSLPSAPLVPSGCPDGEVALMGVTKKGSVLTFSCAYFVTPAEMEPYAKKADFEAVTNDEIDAMFK